MVFCYVLFFLVVSCAQFSASNYASVSCDMGVLCPGDSLDVGVCYAGGYFSGGKPHKVLVCRTCYDVMTSVYYILCKL